MAAVRSTRKVLNILALITASLALSACLEGQGSNVANLGTDEVTLRGSVGDGPIIGATMQVADKDGDVLANFTSDSSASYDVTVDVASDAFPLRIDATGGTDLVTSVAPKFGLQAVAVSPGHAAVNLNPFSTIVSVLAQELPGGLDSANLAAAEDLVVSQLNSGLSSLAASGVTYSRIDDSNLAEMVRSSEILAETLRRTGALLSAAGFATTIDELIGTLASDLSDGVIDGRGGPSADPRASAVATLVYAQVLMEGMANRLRVNGVDATLAMNQAILQVGNAPEVLVDDLTITGDMILRARVGIAAAFEVTAQASLRALHADVSGLRQGMDGAMVRSLLPAGFRSELDPVLALIASADATTIEAVNAVARGDGSIAAGNRAPSISGSPAERIRAGNAYSFTPTASDADGDTLTFSVDNLPAWAGFDSATGRISGTPGDTDVGVYADIVISVSDGTASDSLAAFAVEVVAASTPNSPPTISGTPSASVTAGSGYSFAPTASDADGDTLTFSIVNRPSWASFDTASGRLSGTPGSADVGEYASIRISVSDGTASASLDAFSIDVTAAPPSNTPPTISGSAPGSATAGNRYSFTPTANDADGDTLTFSIANRPSWASFDTATGRLFGTPGDADVGSYTNIRISVSDGTASDSLAAFSIEVEAASTPNIAPTISGSPPATVTAGTGYSFTPSANDADGDTLTFSISNRPSWASFDTATGRLSGTPRDADVGTYGNIVISVSDGTASDSLSFSVTVEAVSLGTVTLSWTPPTTNEDGSSLTDLAGYVIYWGTAPGSYSDSVTIDNAGISRYVVENLAPGTYEFSVSAVNGDGVESRLSNPESTVVQ